MTKVLPIDQTLYIDRCPECDTPKKITQRMLNAGWQLRCAKCRASLDPLPQTAPVTVPWEWTKELDPRRRYYNKCFEKAAVMMATINLLTPDYINRVSMIHGTYKPKTTGERLGHAWLDIILPSGQRIAFDGVWNRFMDYREYQIAAGIEPMIWYDWPGLSALVSQTHHFGPWDPVMWDNRFAAD